MLVLENVLGIPFPDFVGLKEDEVGLLHFLVEVLLPELLVVIG
jgi:hypothetical protein